MKNHGVVFFKSGRFRLVWFLLVVLIVVSFLTRVILMICANDLAELTFENIIGIFSIGLLYDFINAGYFIIPCLIYLWLVPESLFRKSGQRFIVSVLVFLFTSILLFNAAAEYFFWDEFGTRFNFIAVDYLVYTTEVIGNIRQSYPIEWIITGIVLLSLVITYLSRPFLTNGYWLPLRFKQRTAWVSFILTIPLAGFFLLDSRLHNFSSNTYVNELAGNGMYELFAAYRNNELDYERFYPHIPDSEAINSIEKCLQANSGDGNRTNELSPYHEVRSKGPEKKLNVVLISVESFSAGFMKLFGNPKKLTPFLDSLARHSLVFTNLYATGTRTVRGLEALSLSVPPTPGQSIVRRPNNEHLFTMASVFNQKGYECKYIYGGYGYFDNMNYFFSHNGYKVVDRSALSSDEIDYENIWGVADENLFSLSLREIDRTVASGKPILAHIMTTSNHRPFTYPDGRIDIPSHTGRDGAVKYTDYAIGEFIREASKKEWYRNTVFVITADHCASSAGKTALPLRKYLIPLIIFSPAHILPDTESRLMSQIDIAPTLLGLLNFSYHSKFYGYDILKLKEGNERAFISTYQALGFMERDSLVVLMPGRKPEIRILENDGDSLVVPEVEPEKFQVVKDAISWYQSASYAFKHGTMTQ
jgi:phosphoglycerol transferase MdoB-like AlkP superfamily enzyme